MSFRFVAFFLLVVCVFAVSAANKSPEEALSEKCAKEFKLEKAAIEKFNKTRPVETKDKNIKCYLKCLMVESKLMNAKGEISIPKSEKNKKFAELAHECTKVNDKDLCEKAFLFHKCVAEKEEKHAKKHKA